VFVSTTLGRQGAFTGLLIAYGRIFFIVTSEPLVITSSDSLLERLRFKPYRSKVERRIVPFSPTQDESQIMDNTRWGSQLTAKKGDFLISEVDAPNDYWPIDPVIFEESYVIIRPGYCVKSAVTLLIPLTDITNGDEDRLVTIVSLERPLTVRAGDFYLARGIKGEVWPLSKG